LLQRKVPIVMSKKTALVIGATGVSGRALVSELERHQDWAVIAASRNPPSFPTKARFLQVDLFDPESCREAFSSASDATHVFYTAYAHHPVVAETRAPNARMFANAIPAIEAAAANLQHVSLLQGTKYYGQYLGRFKTPAKEDDPRIAIPHFYYDQQDLLLRLREGKPWSWSITRPHVICGVALGNPLNIVSVLAVYATVLRELSKPLTFPGKPGAFTSIYQATDAGLLARAMMWMSTARACADQAFNVTNGDFFRYENVWPVFARYFGMDAGAVETVDLVDVMSDKAQLWDEINRKYRLKGHPMSMLANWNFANYAFANDWDVMSSTTKLRQFGFHEVIDSETMFLDHFSNLQREGIIPAIPQP
jgi:nucleoside-diphosphate-sugar epimerase